MTTLLTVLAVWGMGSTLFVFALAAAAKTSPATSTVDSGRLQTAEEILERLNLVKKPQTRIPVPARALRAH